MPPPPPGDDLCSPIDIPNLYPYPANCLQGGDGGTRTVIATNTHSTYSNPQPGGVFPSGCLFGYGPDVWFHFMAVSNTVEFTFTSLSSALATPVVVLYEKTDLTCDHLIPHGCFGSTTTFTDTFKTLTPGKEYLIGMSGSSATDTGSFQLMLHWFNDCSQCEQGGTLTTFPPPVNGYYAPGTTVLFTYTVTDFNQPVGVGLHSVVPVMYGSGWDQASISPVSAAGSWDSLGSWGWNTSVNTSIGQLTGFFYESTLPNGNSNTDPSDNYGDHAPFNNTWTFSWKTTVYQNCNNDDLSFKVLVNSDNITGAGTISGCLNEEQYHGYPRESCCPALQISTSFVSCTTGAHDGDAYFMPNGSGPYSYLVLNAQGDTIWVDPSHTGTLTLTDTLAAGDYTVYATDLFGGCMTAQVFRIESPLQYTVTQNRFGCEAACDGGAVVNITAGTGPYQITWYDAWNAVLPLYQAAVNSPQAVWLCENPYYVEVTDQTTGCTVRDSIYVEMMAGPLSEFHYYALVKDTVCPGVYPVLQQPYTSGGYYVLETPLTGFSVDSTTGTFTIGNWPRDTVLTVHYYAPNAVPCPGTWYENVEIFGAGSQVTVANNHISGCFGSPLPGPFTALPVTAGDTVNWYGAPGHQNLLFSNSTTFLPFSGPVTTTGHFVFYVAASGTAHCSASEDSVIVDIYPLPAVTAGADVTICPGALVHLAAGNAASVVWSPAIGLDDPFSFAPGANPTQTTTYTVTGTDAVSGCTNVDSVTVTVGGGTDCGVYAYSGFTPNGDGKNDEWIIEGLNEFRVNRVSIFNRWGQIVWSHYNYDNAETVWRGRNDNEQALPEGTYFYVIITGDQQIKGWVELSR